MQGVDATKHVIVLISIRKIDDNLRKDQIENGMARVCESRSVGPVNNIVRPHIPHFLCIHMCHDKAKDTHPDINCSSKFFP